MGRITRDARKLLIGRLGEKKEKHAMYNEVLTRAHWTRQESDRWTVTQSQTARLS